MIKTLSAEQSAYNVTSKFSVKRYNKFDMKASVMGAFIFYNCSSKKKIFHKNKVSNKAQLATIVFSFDIVQVDAMSVKLIIK